jgi:hypothetical protein
VTCDGSPGNPGIETVPSSDGVEKYACTGCSVCKPRPEDEQTEMDSFNEAVNTVAQAMGAVGQHYQQMFQEVAKKFMTGPPMNRAQRRAHAKRKRRMSK